MGDGVVRGGADGSHILVGANGGSKINSVCIIRVTFTHAHLRTKTGPWSSGDKRGRIKQPSSLRIRSLLGQSPTACVQIDRRMRRLVYHSVDRMVRNRHRRTIEQTPRRWRGDRTSSSVGTSPDRKELGLWTKFATSIRKVDFTMCAILRCDGMGDGRYSTHARSGSTVGSSNRAPGCLGSAAASGCATLFMASASTR